ncbi:MAG: 4-hydroxythreonine-4-phosphate dehydrogenase PdxA [Nitrospinae bacterium]|nr:4-hydroxythreonine-4-phosphate dehydrogenase PdxA [Nitrospinota bacterium]
MKDKTLPRFVITVGDPAGVGPEVSLKALDLVPLEIRRRLVVACDRTALDAAIKLTRCKTKFSPFEKDKLPPTGKAAFHEAGPGLKKIPKGRPSAEGGASAAEYIKAGVGLSLKKYVSGIITGPLHKKALHLAGYPYPGHTEMLADLTGTKKFAMMLASEEMRVVVLTTHLSLKEAIKKTTQSAILEKLVLIQKGLSPKKPIGVCGLNPHAGDGGLFGDEEERIISPAIKKARGMGINAVGPLPADTAFAPGVRGKYGAFLAMYHDQGLVAIKAVSFGDCANITLGLPFIRTSVDHGTAMDIAGRGKARPDSMLYAIKSAFALAGKK